MKLVAHVKGTQSWDLLRIVLALLVALAIMATAAGSPMRSNSNASTDFDRQNHSTATGAVDSTVREGPARSFDPAADANGDYSESDSSPYQLEASRPSPNDIWLDVRQFAVISCVA
ncbi:MAG: hypothetical protein HYV60_21410 [Planctomycetia bacterium]|nr:hypothetical protein [Planctomycetia bacterium]